MIYLHIPEADQFLMLDIDSKGEKDDLTPAEKKDLRELAHDQTPMLGRSLTCCFLA
jgi:hypothetical protein